MFRHSSRDIWVVVGAAGHLAALSGAWALVGQLAERHGSDSGALAMSAALVALAMAGALCWAANTVSHIHLHTPLFRRPRFNQIFSLFLTVTLGIPQTFWRRRHFQHHRLSIMSAAPGFAPLAGEVMVIAAARVVLALLAPGPVTITLLAAWALGLGLCAVQGHYEHAGAEDESGVDHHGAFYNRLWFNDGYHRCHHTSPGAHWTTAARNSIAPGGRVSRWPPLLRWAEGLGAPSGSAFIAGALDGMERLAIGLAPLRRFLVRTHERAFRRLLAGVDSASIGTVCVIGGGLFPRTVLVLRRILPRAHLTIVDASAAHLACARRLLRAPPGAGPACPDAAPTPPITFLAQLYQPPAWPHPQGPAAPAYDLVVVPLAYRGERRSFYERPPARFVIVHEWLWKRGGHDGTIVSRWLLKRINLVNTNPPPTPEPPNLVTLGQYRIWSLPCRVNPPISPAVPRPRPWLSMMMSSRASERAIVRRS